MRAQFKYKKIQSAELEILAYKNVNVSWLFCYRRWMKNGRWLFMVMGRLITSNTPKKVSFNLCVCWGSIFITDLYPCNIPITRYYGPEEVMDFFYWCSKGVCVVDPLSVSNKPPDSPWLLLLFRFIAVPLPTNQQKTVSRSCFLWEACVPEYCGCGGVLYGGNVFPISIAILHFYEQEWGIVKQAEIALWNIPPCVHSMTAALVISNCALKWNHLKLKPQTSESSE